MPNYTNSPLTNKLTIYLVKPTYRSINYFLRAPTDGNLNRVEIPSVGTFVYEKSEYHYPDWLSKFFLNDSNINQEHFKSSSPKAALIVPVKVSETQSKFFVICFGTGRFLFKDSAFEERFGLITTLNSIDETKIRSLDRKTLATNPKLAREQISKASISADFEIDFERDLLQSITGSSKDSDLGKTLTGRGSLSISAKVDISNVKERLKKVLEIFQNDSYKTNFKWIDQMQELKDSTQIVSLNARLLDLIKADSQDVWLAIPEIIDWEGFSGYKYSVRKGDDIQEELSIEKMKEELEINDSVTWDDFRKNSISVWDEDEMLNSWPVSKWLNAEISDADRVFVLSDGNWYQVSRDFVREVDAVVNGVRSSGISYIDYTHASEADYNAALATRLSGANLDHQEIPYGKGNSKFEFCDVLTNDKQLIHVKRYYGSAGLSHLFAQGLTSAELLVKERPFRMEVRKKLLKTNNSRGDYSRFKDLISTGTKINAGEFSIIYSIIQKGDGPLRLPFFSKISLKNAVESLRAYNYEVYLDKIKKV
ncbi:MAG: TIGR04141 family sporadically distributed protein [Bacteroidia bacterium]|nr:TIGR04141 family sporadically distributed protein [Bacteroidia bacterium]